MMIFAGEGQKACAELKAFACGDAFKSLDCKNLELHSLRRMLSSLDMQVASPQGAQPDCNKAMRKGLVLFDIVAIATPFVAFRTNKTKGEQAAVSALFSSLNIRAFMPRSEPKAAEFKGESEAPGSTHDVSASLLETRARRASRSLQKWISAACVGWPSAEIYAVEHLNAAQNRLPPEKLKQAIPLELNAGGATNLQRLCSSFSAHGDPILFENLSCSLKDTLLPGLEAEGEGETSQATETSFAETSPAKAEPGSKQSKNMSRENAQLSFSLMELRAGHRKAAAKLLNVDAGSSFDACKKALKGLADNEVDISADGLQCSISWEKETWEKKLHCPKKLLNIQCAASRGIYQIYEGGLRGSIEDFLRFLAREAACGGGEAACSEKLILRQSPFKVIAANAALFNKGLRFVPAGENMLRLFMLLSGNAWKDGKDILSGNEDEDGGRIGALYSLANCSTDGIEVMFRNFSSLVTERKTSLLLSRWLPHTIVQLVKKRMAKKYSKRHLQNFYLQLRNCIDVVVHPLAFLQLNQLSFTRSEVEGDRSSAGGLSQKLDGMLAEAATKGLPQRLKQKLQSGANLTTKDYRGINFAHVRVPKVNTWQDYVKAEVLDHLAQWMLYPENEERLQYECSGGTPSNIFAMVKDSMELLGSAEAESLTLIGKVVSPKETSLGKTGFFKGILKKMLRLPPYKAQHQSFVAVKIDVPEALKALRTLTNIYMQHKDDFANQHVFVNAALDLFAHYEKKYSSPSRDLLGVGIKHCCASLHPSSSMCQVKRLVPENTLVPKLHPYYASLPQPERLREMKDSAMSGFFRHIWTLMFSVSANNMLNAAHVDKLEKTFTEDAWRKTLDGVTEMANTGNETGQASMGGSCPPMGLCIGDNGSVFIPDPTGSPPLTALQVVLKTGVMASLAVFAGPVLAVYNIAVSNFEILSRLEMALGNAVQRIIQRLLKSKVVKNIKKMFKQKEDVAEEKKYAKISSSTKQAGLGDEVDATVSAFVQIQQRRLCERC
ncbi:hypothetical protein Emag_000296 [Eimeria magna]